MFPDRRCWRRGVVFPGVICYHITDRYGNAAGGTFAYDARRALNREGVFLQMDRETNRFPDDPITEQLYINPETLGMTGSGVSAGTQWPGNGPYDPGFSGNAQGYANVSTQAGRQNYGQPNPNNYQPQPPLYPPAPSQQSAGGDTSRKGSGPKTAVVVILAVALFAVTCALMFLLGKNNADSDTDDGATAQVTDEAGAGVADGTSSGTTESAGTTAPAAAETAAPATTAASVPATTAAAPTASPQNSWESAPANQLYHPDSSCYVNNYNAYVFCIDIEVQDYVKMRKGPSKTKFDTVGVIIPNYNIVTVETVSVNGWSLCVYNGTEGWIRSDFLFGDINDIIPALPDGVKVPEGTYQIKIDNPADGDIVNLRAQPKTDSEVVIQLPAGAYVSVLPDTTVSGGRVYVTYQPGAGSQYPNDSYSGYIMLQYLRYVG